MSYKGIQKLSAQNIQNETDVKKEVEKLTYSDGKYFWLWKQNWGT